MPSGIYANIGEANSTYDAGLQETKSIALF